MNKQQVRDTIVRVGIVPVVRAPSPALALMAVEAVCRGGIPVVEITMTVPGAIDVIRDLVRSADSSVLVGAGTVLNADVARQCVDAGAQFLVTPGVDQPTIEFAEAHNLTVIPGALTPTEIMTALRLGADFIKIFPCGEVGGPRYIKALRGPFPDLPMIPTGGVKLETAAEFLRAGAVALGVGGELVSAQALKANAFEAITANARRFVDIVAQARECLLKESENHATVGGPVR